MTKLFFVHIPKNAGTSVEHFIDMELSNRAPCYWEGALLKRHNNFYNKYDFFTGHMVLNVKDLLPTDTKVITFIRDPLSRAISTFNYAKTKTDLKLYERVKDLDFNSWLKHPKLKHHLLNHQLRHFSCSLDFLDLKKQAKDLSNDEIKKIINNNKLYDVKEIDFHLAMSRVAKLDFIGQVERFDDSMHSMTNMLNFKSKYTPVKENITNKKLITKSSISEDTLKLFKEESYWEYKLVEFMRCISNSQIEIYK